MIIKERFNKLLKVLSLISLYVIQLILTVNIIISIVPKEDKEIGWLLGAMLGTTFNLFICVGLYVLFMWLKGKSAEKVFYDWFNGIETKEE